MLVGADKPELLRLNDIAFRTVAEAVVPRGPITEHDGDLYVCSGPDLKVQRWNGTHWSALGGDVAREAGYRSSRYAPETCTVAFDRTGAPVVAWTADHGAKAWNSNAARWNSSLGRWVGLGEGLTFGVTASVFMDPRSPDIVFLADAVASSQRRGAKVFKWDGAALRQLGKDEELEGAFAEAIGVFEGTIYILITVPAANELRLLRWSGQDFQIVASRPSARPWGIAFTPSGRPIIAASETREDRVEPPTVWVVDGASWQALPPLPLGPTSDVRDLDLDVASNGTLLIAWTEAVVAPPAEDASENVRAVRFVGPLP